MYNSEEGLIRELEEQERQAVLQQDIAALERLWSEEFIVNNPQNQISISRGDVLARVQQGLIRYAAFDRQIEMIRFDADIALVMGAEIVEPVGNAPHTGGSVVRRFTNIWRKRGDQWRMIARHANGIAPVPSVEPSGIGATGDISEASLRAADAEQMRIIMQGDADAQQAFMHPNYRINGPSNRVLHKSVLVNMLANGKMGSDFFERVIEDLAITGNVGIVMGREVVHPTPASELGIRHGDTVLHRRFTNVFLFEDGKWRFLARQATIVDEINQQR